MSQSVSNPYLAAHRKVGPFSVARTLSLPPHSVSPLMPRIEFFSPLFPSLPFLFLSFFSLFFPPLPFSPLCASLTHGSVGKKRRIATGTMRRNWKSPDAENWPFPMIPWIYRALTRDSFEDLLFRPIIIIVIIIIVSSSPDFYRLSKKLRFLRSSFRLFFPGDS